MKVWTAQSLEAYEKIVSGKGYTVWEKDEKDDKTFPRSYAWMRRKAVEHGLTDDGHAVAAGLNTDELCSVQHWEDLKLPDIQAGPANAGESSLPADADRYTGDTGSDAPDGEGVITWADGSKYTGEWKDGMRSGLGIMVWADGSKYAGEWKNDKREGCGVMRSADGGVSSGFWADDRLVG